LQLILARKAISGSGIMKTIVISQPMLFPWPGFFEQLMLADVYGYLDDTQFSKGSVTNRIQVKISEKTQWMTIPLAGKGTFTQISDLKPADTSWKESHRELLLQSLKGSPYRDDALSIFDKVYLQTSLCEMLIASVEETAKYLGIGSARHIFKTSEISIQGKSWPRVLDIVKHFRGNRYLTGHGAAAYLDHVAFESKGITVEYMKYSLTPWPQGRYPFTPYVSILDLIGHTGVSARNYLHPDTTPWRQFLESKGLGPKD
jgi:hypothetical protein